MRTVALPVVLLVVMASLAILESGVLAPTEEAPGLESESPAPALPAPRSTPASQPAPNAPPAPSPAPNPKAAPVTMLATAKVPAPAALPATLELIALPTIPGARATSQTISRTEAIASAIASPGFQETVSPLARLYLATFGRYPDYEGLNYYTGQREEARPLAEIATEFAGSQEFDQRYGSLDNAEFVARIVANVLGHESQADVRAYWTTELDEGRMTRGQVIVDLAESGMFRERTAHQVFVATAYTEILHRTPDPVGYNYWVSRLRAGQPPNTVISGLLGGR